jgi:hypothetical protein
MKRKKQNPMLSINICTTLVPLMTTLDFASVYKNAKLSSRKKEKADGEREISLIPALDDVGCLIGDEGLLFKRTIFTDEQVVRLSNIIRSLTNGWNSANGRGDVVWWSPSSKWCHS